MCGKSLYILLNFAVKLELLENKKKVPLQLTYKVLEIT